MSTSVGTQGALLAAWASIVDRSATLGVDPTSIAPALAALVGEGSGSLATAKADDVSNFADRYERGLPAEHRRVLGAFYTPANLADGLLDITCNIADRDAVPPRVLDPSCGAGSFLLAAAEAGKAAGHDPVDVVDRLWGVDIDPVALGLCQAGLRLWLTAVGVDPALAEGPHLIEGDYLSGRPSPGGFDLVVGNPPFLNQLESATARTAQRSVELKARFGSAGSGYGDTSALFLLAALDDLVDGGRVMLVLPDSFVSSAGTAEVRRQVLDRAQLVGFWDGDARHFDASVFVCAPVLERGSTDTGSAKTGSTHPVRRFAGAGFERLSDGAAPEREGSWAPLLRRGGDIPQVSVVSSAPRLETLATATAGFRDQFYGLAPHIAEAEASGPSGLLTPPLPGEGGAALVTSGLIDPLELWWGARPARFAGTKYRAPVVDLESLATDPPLAAWVGARLVPKVVVAMQTRVVECVPDPAGQLVPSVPTVSVECDQAVVFRVAAALTSPFATAWAMGNVAGSALSTDALKLSAKQILQMPLPSDRPAWDRGAEIVATIAAMAPEDPEREALMQQLGVTMAQAYGMASDDPCIDWWDQRRHKRTRRPA